jgi:hypothetical protein
MSKKDKLKKIGVVRIRAEILVAKPIPETIPEKIK